MLHLPRFAPLACLQAGLLASCAAPPPVVSASGRLPASGAYALSVDEDGTGEAWRSAVIRRLEARGLVPGSAPSYLLEMARSERPASIGTAPAGTKDGTGASKRQVTTLTVALTDTRTGDSIYRAAAAVSSRKPIDEATISALAALVVPAKALVVPAKGG